MNDADRRALHEQLTNWGRWSKSGGPGRGRCGSIESRYLPEALTEAEAEARRSSRRAPLDPRDAERIDAGVALLLRVGLVIDYHLLTLMYLDGLSFDALAHRFEHGRDGVQKLWAQALEALDDALHQLARPMPRAGRPR